MTEPTINVDLMRKTFEYIEAHPEEHDQGTWASHDPDCGTTRCFAGTALHLSPEYKLNWTIDPDDGWQEFMGATHIDKSEVWLRPSCAGRDALGLSEDQAGDMFYANNLEDLYVLAEQYTGIDFRPEVTADA